MQRKKKGHTTAVDSSGKAVKKSCGSSGCPYLQQKAVERFREEALLEVQDVEQLVTVGRKLSACPYYGSRAAVSDAQVCICTCCSLFVVKSRDFSSWIVSENIVTYRSQVCQFALSLCSTCSIFHRFVALSYLFSCMICALL